MKIVKKNGRKIYQNDSRLKEVLAVFGSVILIVELGIIFFIVVTM